MADLSKETNNQAAEVAKEKQKPLTAEDMRFPIFGVAKTEFSDKEIERLVRGGKSEMHTFKFENEKGEPEEKAARMSAYRNEKGYMATKIFTRFPEMKLNDQISGIPYTAKEKEALEKGNAILKKDIPSKDSQGTYNAWVQVDKDLNRLEMLGEARFPLPKEILKKDITHLHEEFRTKGEARVEGMTAKDGKPFDALLKVDLIKGNFEFVFDQKKKEIAETESLKQEETKNVEKKKPQEVDKDAESKVSKTKSDDQDDDMPAKKKGKTQKIG